jgi:O-methyltransferase
VSVARAAAPHGASAQRERTVGPEDRAVDLYLDLLMNQLTGSLTQEHGRALGTTHSWGSPRITHRLADRLGDVLACVGITVLVQRTPYDAQLRTEGRDRPGRAETMIGLRRMQNIRDCIETVLRDGIAGDLIETGVWRGGATIFMRAVLKAHGDTTRTVWVADSFRGLPPPNVRDYPADANDLHHVVTGLRVGVDAVRENFRRYGLLDDQVRFLEGWFRDTLPAAPIDRLSVMRLDGDMYESTMQALDAMYAKLSPGGFCIIDDYVLTGCRRAVDEFRERERISEPLQVIDWTGVCWRKALEG